MARYWGCICNFFVLYSWSGSIYEYLLPQRNWIKYDVFLENIISIIPSFIPTIILCIAMNVFFKINSLWSLLIAVILIVVVYSVSVWLFAMNKYEKEIFTKPLKKIFHKKKAVNG